jgi:hypothetical protein
MGLQDTETSEFYRHRFALFGGSDCPAHQQRFSKVLTTVLDKADASRGWADSKNTAVFMDDGHGVQPEALSEAQAISQYVLEIPYRILYVKYGLIPQEL